MASDAAKMKLVTCCCSHILSQSWWSPTAHSQWATSGQVDPTLSTDICHIFNWTECRSGRSPVIVGVGVCKGVLNGTGVPHLCSPVPLQVHVSSSDHLGSQQEALVLGQLDVCGQPLVGVLQVALVGVEHHWCVPVVLGLKVDGNCIYCWLHVGVLCIYQQPHVALHNKQTSFSNI